MQLFYGVPDDIENWMSLVTRVRWNFPGLETQEKLDEHKATVLRFMGKRQAICVKEGNEIAGVMLFSRGHNMICCASGSACTYENRMSNNVGIEMASVIPNFHGKYDIYDLVSCTAPRRLLIVSSDEDKYSKDASYVVEKASPVYKEFDALHNLQHKRYKGGHALTKERFDDIIEWVCMNS